MTLNPILSGSFTPKRILVIKLRHHGDMLLITPVISALKQHYADATIDVLLYEETRDMLAANPEIHRIFAIDRRWKQQGTRHQLGMEWALMRDLRRQHYDLVLNLADQWRSAIITAFTRAPVRIGFDFPKRRHPLWRLCHTVLALTDSHATQHTVEQNLEILQPLGLSLPPGQGSVTMSYAREDWDACRALLGEDTGEGYVVIQPTSRWFFKCWREARMSEVINALSAAGRRIVITSGPDARELQMVEDILAGCPQANVTSLAGKLTLRQLAALIDHAALFIGVDSVPMHMAAALETPLIALFGPSKLTFWRPWQAKGEVIWAGDFGSLPDPDDINTNTDERYLDLIPTEAVIAAAKRILP
ncbi:putative lipopolysaccharide heptosyltransferase III [Enterobacillus tribolii]|uniref:Lipopolysaccharide heptosyltransferase 3 n=1 Tax=Enterobacillus tribolii TaxID=1487935 RepID=A0A370QUF5_9GAMM|nr:putative lipopolysaccharide heptosyltransferase III [Enterobacillus tribolii]MBW7981067.1 putative lipopolysaccharide heptosyltransferase III [Enterobacillus tribolii]RDK92876.1 heptosyltransferase-3 [Enterobacillus tribolii]